VCFIESLKSIVYIPHCGESQVNCDDDETASDGSYHQGRMLSEDNQKEHAGDEHDRR
jgi:hypothetical protein